MIKTIRPFIGWTASAFAVCMAASIAVAQEGGAAQPPPAEGAAQPGAAAPGAPGGANRPRRSGLARQLGAQLQLTDEQQQKIDELSQAHFQKMRNQPGAAEQRQKLMAMRDEMKAAREANDTKRLDELRTEIQKVSNESREQNAQAMQELYGEIDKILTPEQQAKFKTMREKWTARPANFLDDPTYLRRAVFNIKLGVEQREKIEALFKDNRQAVGALSEGDRETKAELGRKLRENVLKELTEEQRAQLIEAERLSRQRAGQGEAPAAGK